MTDGNFRIHQFFWMFQLRFLDKRHTFMGRLLEFKKETLVKKGSVCCKQIGTV